MMRLHIASYNNAIKVVLAVYRYNARNLLALFLFLSSACVYRVDVQQGNLLEANNIEAVKVGMTRSQVRYLLGTPIVDDFFHHDRWDYFYYLRKGRNRNAERRWLIVYFDGDLVRSIARDVPARPG